MYGRIHDQTEIPNIKYIDCIKKNVDLITKIDDRKNMNSFHEH